jgi:hypothetical protein
MYTRQRSAVRSHRAPPSIAYFRGVAGETHLRITESVGSRLQVAPRVGNRSLASARKSPLPLRRVPQFLLVSVPRARSDERFHAPVATVKQEKRQKPCITSAARHASSDTIAWPDAVLLRPAIRGSQRAKTPAWAKWIEHSLCHRVLCLLWLRPAREPRPRGGRSERRRREEQRRWRAGGDSRFVPAACP